MAWSVYQRLLAALLLTTGVINLLALKWTDMAIVKGRPDGILRHGSSTQSPHAFFHPGLQTLAMFVGELVCLAIFKIVSCLYKRRAQSFRNESRQPTLLRRKKSFNPIILLLSSICNMIGTTVMYTGISLTYVASAQMFRGSVLLFSSLLSTVIFRRRQAPVKWIGLAFILVALVALGFTDWSHAAKNVSKSHTNPMAILTGDVLVVAAQIMIALKIVLEEKFVLESDVPPLQAVGWEGLFGVGSTCLLLVLLNIVQIDGAPMEDTIDGLYQINNSRQIAIGFFGAMLSIAIFNFASASLVRELSTGTRIMIDAIRSILIWFISLALQWQNFTVLTLEALLVLLIGTHLFHSNSVTLRSVVCERRVSESNIDVRQPLLQ